MPQRRTTSEMQKNMNEWIQKLRDLLHKKERKNQGKGTSIESCTKQFKRKIREGPYFICSVFNRIFYEKSLMRCTTSTPTKHFSTSNNHLMVKNIYTRHVIKSQKIKNYHVRLL